MPRPLATSTAVPPLASQAPRTTLFLPKPAACCHCAPRCPPPPRALEGVPADAWRSRSRRACVSRRSTSYAWCGGRWADRGHAPPRPPPAVPRPPPPARNGAPAQRTPTVQPWWGAGFRAPFEKCAKKNVTERGLAIYACQQAACVHHFRRNSNELGAACGSCYRIG